MKNKKESQKITIIQDDGDPYETCVLCGTKTNVLKSTHIDIRNGYYEGVGQVCDKCVSEKITS